MGQPKISREVELLAVVMEECAEVQQEAAKLIRFGMDAQYQGVKTVDKLEREVGDLTAMVSLLMKYGLVNEDKLEQYKKEKLEKLKMWSNLIED